MKKNNFLNGIMIIGLAISVSSCRLTDFTVISTKNVTLEVKKDVPRVSAKGWTVKGAIDKAIEKAGPGYDALIDGVIYDTGWRFKVEGTPIKTSETKK